MFKLLLCLSVALPTIITTQSTFAQEDGTVRYDQTYFSNYKTVSLEDMIRAIPGGTPIVNDLIRAAQTSASATKARGFGSSGAQFLINGKRMPGKANDMAKNLKRVQASQVDYIELIRGNAEGLDIRNEGILINVILKKGAENVSSTFLEVRADYSKGIPLKPNGQIAHNGKKGDLSYGISYLYKVLPRVQNWNEDVLNADSSPRQWRPMRSVRNRGEHNITGNIGYDMGDNGSFTLNGLYADIVYSDFRDENHFDIAANNTQSLAAFEKTVFDWRGNKWEVGGDYENRFGAIGNLKALFVINEQDRLDSTIQDRTVDGVTTNNFDSLADYTTGEKIFRAAMTTPITEGHSLEWGGEGAFTTLDKSQVFASAANDIALVKEDRFEVFATHSFTISDAASLSSSLTGEFSKVFQDREGFTNTNKYNFLKPRFEFRYNFSASDQLRVMSERKVSQLDLNHFVASRNIEDDSINFGNPNLVPEKTWEHTISYEKRFPDDAGSIEVKGIYQDISDHIDRIQIGDAIVSGVGNIGKAKKYGFDIDGNLRFGFIGLPQALVTVSYSHRETETTDPFTGLERTTSDPRVKNWSIDFQHDVSEWNFKYGFNVHRNLVTWRQDIFLLEKRFAKRHVTLYAEYTYNNIKAKANFGHILGDKKMSDKTYYVGHITNDVIDRIENQQNKMNPDFYFSLQTTF
jgi:hypothetical protein